MRNDDHTKETGVHPFVTISLSTITQPRGFIRAIAGSSCVENVSTVQVSDFKDRFEGTAVVSVESTLYR